MSDEADVLAVFEALYETACVRRDAAGVVALFAEDGDVTMWGSDESERAHGHAELRRLAEGIAASQSELRFRWDEQRVHLEGDVAWVNASGAFSVDGEEHAYRVTGIFVRRDGRWRWHTHSGSEPR